MTDPVVTRHQENTTVESWLLFYEDRLLDYAAAREEVLESTPAPATIRSGQRYGKSATQAKAMNLCALAEKEPWLVFIQDFECSLSDAPHLLVILRLRRQYRNHRGRRGWVGPVQVRFPNELAAITGRSPEDHFKAGRNTFHHMWREVVDLAAREAIRRGLL